MCIIINSWSYINHTFVILIYTPLCDEILTAIFILFSSLLYNYYYIKLFMKLLFFILGYVIMCNWSKKDRAL